MFQEQSVRRYPGVTTAAVTLNVTFRARATEGTGTFDPLAEISTLSIVFPQGRTDSVTHEAIREAIVAHCLNSDLLTWWNPESGTPEASLRTALGAFVFYPSAGTLTLPVLFDGQFGPVSVG